MVSQMAINIHSKATVAQIDCFLYLQTEGHKSITVRQLTSKLATPTEELCFSKLLIDSYMKVSCMQVDL